MSQRVKTNGKGKWTASNSSRQKMWMAGMFYFIFVGAFDLSHKLVKFLLEFGPLLLRSETNGRDPIITTLSKRYNKHSIIINFFFSQSIADATTITTTTIKMVVLVIGAGNLKRL